MKHIIWFSLCIMTWSLLAQTKAGHASTPLVAGLPQSTGMSTERLDRIDKMLNQAIAKNEIPGAVALVVKNNKIVYHKAFGNSDFSPQTTMNKDAIFRIASQTKAITATAIMMLWEEGKFKLDDPISMYIPEFANVKILDQFNEKDSTYTSTPAKKSITIRHLLTHTSGLGYGIIDGDERIKKIYAKAGILELFTTEKISIKDNIKKLATLPLHHEPGEKFTYSLGLDVLGYLIEIVSEMPLDKFFKERIFNPLQMNETWFYLPTELQNKLIPVITKKDNKWTAYTTTEKFDPNYPKKGFKTFFSGGAGLCSTAKDYAQFLQMYLNNGEYNGTRLLSRTTVQFMMANQIGNLWGEDGDSYYGLAFGILKQKGQDLGGKGSAGTFEWGGYFNTQYFADPKEKIIGILMKQTMDVSDQTGEKFRQLVFQAVDD